MAATHKHHKQTPSAAVNKAKPASMTAAPQAVAGGIRAAAPEGLSVVGRHRSTGAQTYVSALAFQKAIPGTSVLKILDQLPGIFVTTDDAQGLDTGGIAIFMHGFSQNQLGFTLDGIPLGEPVYRNYNGLNTVEAISSENVGHMDVTQGAGALSMPSTNSLGGGLQIYSADPLDKMGGQVSQTFGSNATYHTFIRFDSGQLNHSGTKFFVSYMRNDTQMWAGSGDQFLQQVNAKLVQPINDRSKMSVFFDWSNLAQFNYQDISLNYINTLGYRVANYYPNYKAAYLAAQGTFTHGENLTNDPEDVSFYAGTTQTTDYLGGVNLNLQLNDRLHWDSVIYGHGQIAATQFSDPYLASPNGAPLAEIVKRPEIHRFGFTSALTYTIARNAIHTGIWYENNQYISPMYAYSDPILTPGMAPPDPLRNFTNPFAELFGQDYNTNTFLYYLEDTYRPVKGLSLHAGFKSLISSTRVSETANVPSYTGTDKIAGGVGLTSAEAFLPHLSADWHFLRNHEVFVDVSKNMRAYPECGYHLCASPFAVSQEAFDSVRHSIRPETDWTYQVGYRFNSRHFIASATLFHVDFFNRLGSTYSGSVINPQLTVANLGSVSMNGVDADMTIIPIDNLRIFNSFSFNRAVYDNNVNISGVNYDIRNKLVVDTPEFMYKTAADYTWHNADVHFDANYIGRRPFSYTNDVFVSPYWLATTGVNYTFHDVRPLQKLTVSFNVGNLFNSKYISLMGASMSGDSETLQAAAPRQFFGSIKAAF